jgi:hypothetical protein
MILPAPKYFRIVKNITFDYRFTYATGTSIEPAAIDLTGYIGSLVLTLSNGDLITYTTGGSPGTSGVFFGGDNDDPTNGIIDLIITATDTGNIEWTQATYSFEIIDPLANVYLLLVGGFGVVSPSDIYTFLCNDLEA